MAVAQVLVIEDDPGIAQAVVQALVADGCAASSAASAEAGLVRLGSGSFELLVLDLMLPGRSGWDVLAVVRRDHPALLVLMVTARDALDDRVRGLREGADDYLVKPFATTELLARVQALLRRSRATPQAELALADLRLDALRRGAWRGGRELDLTQREFDLLHLLLRHAGRTVSRDMLAREVWQQPLRATPLDNLIDVHMAHLRRKLEEHGASRLLHTVRGVGYQLGEREP